MLKLLKIVNYRRCWTGKDGKERPNVNFYLVLPLPNGEEKRVAIVPAFADKRPSDYTLLDSCAEKVIIKKDDPLPDAPFADENPLEENPQPAKPDKK